MAYINGKDNFLIALKGDKGDSGKIFRHSIRITKTPNNYDSEGNITASGQASFYFRFSVYRSTAKPLTITDIDVEELSGAKSVYFYYFDSPEGARVVDRVVYIDNKLRVFYYTDITTASTTNLDCDQYNYNVLDIVTEV